MSSSAKSRKTAALAAEVKAEASEQDELPPVMLIWQSRSSVVDSKGETLDLVENFFDIGGMQVLCHIHSLHPFPEGHPNFGHMEMRLRGALIFSQRPDRLN